MSAPTPKEFLRSVIGTWEGLYSNDPADPGNWVTHADGSRSLVGTMRGVTAEAFAEHHGIPNDQVTPEMLKMVTLDEAADVGLQDFFDRAHFDLLTWCPATAGLTDFGWGSGMGQAVKSMQRIVGVTADGQLGPQTAAAYNAWEAGLGWLPALQAIHDMREDFYKLIVQRNPSLGKYLQGWINRDDWASQSNAAFCASWGLNT